MASSPEAVQSPSDTAPAWKGLSGVPQTLLLPIAAAHHENRRADAILRDPAVDTLVAKLDPDLSFFPAGSSQQVGMMARRLLIDGLVQRFLERAPDAAVINLGAGLCTRFSRVDNGRVTWLDVDLPVVEPIWRAAFGEPKRRRFVASSAFDPEWLSEAPETRPLLLVSEAMLCYHPEDQVRELFRRVRDRLGAAELIFDVYNGATVRRTNRLGTIARTGAVMQWGVEDPRVLEQWGAGFRVVEVARIPRRYLRRLGLAAKVLGLLPMARRRLRIVHGRLSPGF